jgi:hypothetical protein
VDVNLLETHVDLWTDSSCKPRPTPLLPLAAALAIAMEGSQAMFYAHVTQTPALKTVQLETLGQIGR